MIVNFVSVFLEIFVIIASIIAVAWRGRDLKNSVADKKELIAESRGSVMLQRSVALKLEDGILDELEIDLLADEIELLVSKNEKLVAAQRIRLIKMIRHARSSQSRSRLLSEIALEVADESSGKS
jgi:hypothetical protein